MKSLNPAKTTVSAISSQTLFVSCLYAASLIPLISVPILASWKSSTSESAYFALNFVAAYCHVGCTLFFYTEFQLQDFIRKNAITYIWLPVALIVSSGLIFAFLPPWVFQNLLIPYFIWQTWHYQRQNLGVLSFIGNITQSGRVTIAERRLLNLGVVIGILGLFKINFGEAHLVFQDYFDFMYTAGLILLFGLISLFGYTIFAKPELRNNPIRFTFLIITTFFYLPTFLFTEPIAAISSYALAHGVQYLVFMGFVGSKGVWKGLIKLILIGVTVGSILYFCGNTSFLFGILPGASMAHFVVDANIWKMSEPIQRGYLKNALKFLN